MSTHSRRITAARAYLTAQSWRALDESALLKEVLQGPLRGKVAVSSSFGAEAAALLHLVAEIDPTTPIIFIDTGMLFAETLSYRDTLAQHLGLSNVQTHTPQLQLLSPADPDGDLHLRDAHGCCQVRKVEPYGQAMRNFDVIITGRKRFHGDARSDLTSAESSGRQIKVNPLANWSAREIEEYFLLKQLPRHPLVDFGYKSIGCAPCTRKLDAGEDVRAGRWCGHAKTECGIHNAPNLGPEKHLVNWS